MTQSMLLFSLGPVQSFIAQARKTRDLWLGSFLLAILMEAAMKGIKQEAFIFPADPTITNHVPDLPNKYIAIFASAEDAQKAAAQSETDIEACWNGICKDVWTKIIQKHVSREDIEVVTTTWSRQTNPRTFFEIFWVIV